MYSKDQLNSEAAKYAKEIVVAYVSNSETNPCSETGKDIADFYSEILKGVSKAMTELISTRE